MEHQIESGLEFTIENSPAPQRREFTRWAPNAFPFERLRPGSNDSFFVPLSLLSEVVPFTNMLRMRAAKQNIRLAIRTGYNKQRRYGVRVWRKMDS